MRGLTRQSEAGVTLLESIVTVAIMGIAFMAIVGAILTNTIASDYHRKSATSETLLRQLAEAQKASQYVVCDSTTSTSTTVIANVTYTLSREFIHYWDGAGSFPANLGTCPGSDNGIQLIRVRVQSNRSNEFVDVVKRNP